MRIPTRNTVVPSFTLTDPTNPRSDYGNSANDVRMRYVGTLVYEPQTHFTGLTKVALAGWRIAPLVQLQTGLPYSPTISSSSFKTVTFERCVQHDVSLQHRHQRRGFEFHARAVGWSRLL